MKRIYMILGLIGALTTNSFAQVSDIEPIIFTPTAGQTIVIDSVNPEPTYLNYAFINHGPDALHAGDTFFFADPFGVDGRILSVDIPMNDTIFLSTDTVNITSGPASGSTDWCLTFIQYGIDTVSPSVIDNNPNNDEICVSVTLENRNGDVGITDLFTNNNQNLNVYPNPVSNGTISFKYEFANATQAIARVTDISGRVVMTKDFGKVNGAQAFSLNVSALNAGLYMIELDTDQGKAVSKFSVRK